MRGGRPRGVSPGDTPAPAAPGRSPNPAVLTPVGAGADAGWHLDAS